MCTISEGRPSYSCSLHLLHQDWFYSASTDPLMTLNGDALRNELNQWYNTARHKTVAFIWPQRVCLCERDYWESPALLMSSYELSWCLIIKTLYECFMSCGAVHVDSCFGELFFQHHGTKLNYKLHYSPHYYICCLWIEIIMPYWQMFYILIKKTK